MCFSLNKPSYDHIKMIDLLANLLVQVGLNLTRRVCYLWSLSCGNPEKHIKNRNEKKGVVYVV